MHSTTTCANTGTDTTRRYYGAHGEGGTRAEMDDLAGPAGLAFAYRAGHYAGTSYQGSAEPFRKPDHKSKKHSRPKNWADRKARRERRQREYGL